MTTGPATSSAIRRASWADFAKPPLEVGIPARATICLDSYSKNRILAARKGSDPALGGALGANPGGVGPKGPYGHQRPHASLVAGRRTRRDPVRRRLPRPARGPRGLRGLDQEAPPWWAAAPAPPGRIRGWAHRAGSAGTLAGRGAGCGRRGPQPPDGSRDLAPRGERARDAGAHHDTRGPLPPRAHPSSQPYARTGRRPELARRSGHAHRANPRGPGRRPGPGRAHARERRRAERRPG